MCEPFTMMTAGASILSTAIGISQQLQRAASQRGEYDYLAAQQRNAAAVDEARARQAEQAGEADAAQARQKAALRSGQQQARFAAQGTDLSGSPLDLLGDTAAAGAEDALSLNYEAARNAWYNGFVAEAVDKFGREFAALDTSGVADRKQARSKYGAKKS